MKHEKTDIERLFKRYYQPMYWVARSILYDCDECRDVVSDVFSHVLSEQPLSEYHCAEGHTGTDGEAASGRC